MTVLFELELTELPYHVPHKLVVRAHKDVLVFEIRIIRRERWEHSKAISVPMTDIPAFIAKLIKAQAKLVLL